MVINDKIRTRLAIRIKEARVARGHSQTSLAKDIGVSRQAVSDYEKGKIAPSSPVLARIAEVLQLPITFFIRPINTEPIPRGTIYFRSLKSTTKKAYNMTSYKLLWLYEIFQFLEQYIEFPNVNIPDFDNEYDLDNLSVGDIEELAVSVRKFWGLGLGPISNLTLLLEKQGFIISRNKTSIEKVDACSEPLGERPFVFLGSDKESAVRSRFDLAHELGHLIMHQGLDEVEQFNREHEAHRFASAFLLPIESFGNEVMSNSLDHFITLKKRWKVSIAAMIYRCEDLDILSKSEVLYLRKKMSKYKMRKVEPLDTELIPESPTTLSQSINMLIENNVMNSSDIVENLKFNPLDIEQLCCLPEETLSKQYPSTPQLRLIKK